MSTTELVDNYFEMWETTDDAKRHELAQELFTEATVQYVAPANVALIGGDAIEANIARVNKENIQQAGLEFRRGKNVENHNSVHVEWEVIAGGSKTVGTGRDFLLLDEDGRIASLYMFMGQ